MAQKNLISFKPGEKELTEIRNLITSLNSKLLPILRTLTTDERVEMLKMGDKTHAFVNKSLDYCDQFTDFVPSFLNVDEFRIDVESLNTLRSIYTPLLETVEAVNDSIMLAGSEAYQAALIFYTSIKAAAKSGIANAETIYDDLSVRFPCVRKKSKAAGGTGE
jgi:hypothetical protein